ncbi:MAG: sugar ABC transporter substrate-binding protein [Chloroflexi bacterium]|nr:MAG: sugar ABC transporter substrate-binding protein [Chloroflexota bacterium]
MIIKRSKIMSRSKSSIFFIGVLVAALVLTSCGTGGNAPAAGQVAAPTAGAAAAPSTGPWKIAYVPTQIGQPVTLAWGKGLESVFKQFPNVTYQAFDGQMKAETQVSVLEDLINQGYNLIVLQPVDAAALSAVVQKAEGKGIPVITINTPVQAKHTAVVQMADVEAGYAVGVEMCKQLNNAGNVAIIQSPPGASLGVNREKGFRNALAEKCPDVKIVGAQNGEWNKDKAIAIMNAFLQANDKLDGVFAANDNMAEGAMVAAESAGRLDKIKIWGANGQSSTLKLIEEGKIAGTAYNDSINQGVVAGDLGMYLLTGGGGPSKAPATGVIKIAPFAATQETVGQIQAADRW